MQSKKAVSKARRNYFLLDASKGAGRSNQWANGGRERKNVHSRHIGRGGGRARTYNSANEEGPVLETE